MKKKSNYIIIVLFISFNCTKIDYKTINFNEYQKKSIKIDSLNYNISLNIFSFKDAYIMHNEKLLVKYENDENYFHIIDLGTGSIVNTFGRKGNGPDEFNNYSELIISFYNSVKNELYIVNPFLSENKIYSIDSDYKWSMKERVNMMHPFQTMPLNSFVPINNNESYYLFDSKISDEFYMIGYHNIDDKNTLKYFRQIDIDSIDKLMTSEFIAIPRINYKTQMIAYFTGYSKNRLFRTIDHLKKISNSIIITNGNISNEDAIYHVYDAYVDESEIILLVNFQKFEESRTYTYIVKMNYDLDVISVFESPKVISRILKYKDEFLVLYVDTDFIGNDDFDIDNSTYKLGTIELQ